MKCSDLQYYLTVINNKAAQGSYYFISVDLEMNHFRVQCHEKHNLESF